MNLAQDRQGRIWFSGEGGVCYYDGHDFWHYQLPGATGWDNVAAGLLEDRHGNIWFGYGDVYCYHDNQFTIYDEHVFPEVAGMLEDRHGNIWMSSWEHGVLRFDGNQVAYIREENGLVANAIDKMKETSTGEAVPRPERLPFSVATVLPMPVAGLVATSGGVVVAV